MSKLNSKFNIYYPGDRTMTNNPKSVLDDMYLLIQEFHSISLALNSSKCEVFIAKSVLAPNINILAEDNLRLPGTRKHSFTGFHNRSGS